MAEISLELYADFTQSADPCEITLDSALPNIITYENDMISREGTGWAAEYTMAFYADRISEYTKFLSCRYYAQGYVTIDDSKIDRLSGASKIIITVSNWASAARGVAYITLIVGDNNAQVEIQVSQSAGSATINFTKRYPPYSAISSLSDMTIEYSATFSQNLSFALYAGTTATSSQQFGTGQFLAGGRSCSLTIDEEKAMELLPNERTIMLVAQSNIPAGTYILSFDYDAYVRKHVIYVGEYNGGLANYMCTVNYYNGSKFVPCSPYYYNGTEWIPCDYGSHIIIV